MDDILIFVVGILIGIFIDHFVIDEIDKIKKG